MIGAQKAAEHDQMCKWMTLETSWGVAFQHDLLPIAPLVAAVGRRLESVAALRHQSLSLDDGEIEARLLLRRVV